MVVMAFSSLCKLIRRLPSSFDLDGVLSSDGVIDNSVVSVTVSVVFTVVFIVVSIISSLVSIVSPKK